MFLVNSRRPLLFDINMILFLPKLQSEFAEFLQNCYLLRLYLLN